MPKPNILILIAIDTMVSLGQLSQNNKDIQCINNAQGKATEAFLDEISN